MFECGVAHAGRTVKGDPVVVAVAPVFGVHHHPVHVHHQPGKLDALRYAKQIRDVHLRGEGAVAGLAVVDDVGRLGSELLPQLQKNKHTQEN